MLDIDPVISARTCRALRVDMAGVAVARCTANPLLRRSQTCAQPEAGQGDWAIGCLFPHGLLALRARTRDCRVHHQQQVAFDLPDQRPPSAPARRPACRPTWSRRSCQVSRPRAPTSGLLHQGVDDPGFLRRAGRSDRHGARACELDEILDIAVLFSLPWVFISPCASSSPVRWVRIGGGLIPGTHSVPGAIGHPTHDFKG